MNIIRHLWGWLKNSATFLTNNGPQIISMFTQILRTLQDAFPTFQSFLLIGMNILNVLSMFPSEIFAVISGITMMNKALGPLMVTLTTFATKNGMALSSVIGLQIGMMAVAGGFMLAMSASEEWVRYAGAIIATLPSP